jgi:hypothetical protein
VDEYSIDKQERKGAMAAADLEVVRADGELERIESWRAEELRRAGYDADQVAALAPRHDIDLHTAVDLVRGGCPHDLALDILL